MTRKILELALVYFFVETIRPTYSVDVRNACLSFYDASLRCFFLMLQRFQLASDFLRSIPGFTVISRSRHTMYCCEFSASDFFARAEELSYYYYGYILSLFFPGMLQCYMDRAMK